MDVLTSTAMNQELGGSLFSDQELAVLLGLNTFKYSTNHMPCCELLKKVRGLREIHSIIMGETARKQEKPTEVWECIDYMLLLVIITLCTAYSVSGINSLNLAGTP